MLEGVYDKKAGQIFDKYKNMAMVDRDIIKDAYARNLQLRKLALSDSVSFPTDAKVPEVYALYSVTEKQDGGELTTREAELLIRILKTVSSEDKEVLDNIVGFSYVTTQKRVYKYLSLQEEELQRAIFSYLVYGNSRSFLERKEVLDILLGLYPLDPVGNNRVGIVYKGMDIEPDFKIDVKSLREEGIL